MERFIAALFICRNAFCEAQRFHDSMRRTDKNRKSASEVTDLILGLLSSLEENSGPIRTFFFLRFSPNLTSETAGQIYNRILRKFYH